MQVHFKVYKIEVVNEIEGFYKSNNDEVNNNNSSSCNNKCSHFYYIEGVNVLLKALLKKLWTLNSSLLQEF